MVIENLTSDWESNRSFGVEIYGVPIRIESNSSDLLDEIASVIRTTFGTEFKIFENSETTDFSFGVTYSKDGYRYYQDGKTSERTNSKDIVLGFLESMVRITVAEHAKAHVFIHAGVVAYRGKAIIIPAQSRAGKTTLVAELIQLGAIYYSDEYAILNESGLCIPFARDLSIRSANDDEAGHTATAKSLGASIGIEPIEVGMMLFTEFVKGSEWNPKFLSVGTGLLEIMPHTISIGANTEFVLDVLKKMSENVIIIKSLRNDAKPFAQLLLNFTDENLF